MTRRRVWINPEYFFVPFTRGCRSRVRRTYDKAARQSYIYKKVLGAEPHEDM